MKIIVRLLVGGFKKCPKEIIKKLKLKNCGYYKKGDFRGKSKLTHKENCIVFNSVNLASINNTSEALIKRIKKCHSQIIKECPNQKRHLSIVAYCKINQFPAIYFTNKVLKKISKMNVSIDIDLYNH